MSHFREKLLQAVARIDRSPNFCTSGRLPAIFPGLEVSGVDSLGLPLSRSGAASLKKRAHQAPYGKGVETLVDTKVRRVWEIDAGQVTLANSQWTNVLAQALKSVQSALGLEKQKLEAHLYKLLLYEKGSFFLPHRDGEKLDRMVATLVIVLPSPHEGGELVVRHEGREVVVDFAPDSRFHTQFAAFYADCEHEVRPVTSGHRLTLVYNLTIVKSKRKIGAPAISGHVAGISRLLADHLNANDTPFDESTEAEAAPKLAILLDHEYTQAGLTFDALKGADRAKADVLFAAAMQAGIDAYLGLVTYWERGSADDDDYAPHHRSGHQSCWSQYNDDESDDASDHTMGEIYERGLSASCFSDAEGASLEFGEIPLDEAQIVTRTPLGSGEPTKEEFEGYTGNAGMTLDRWYHHAAVVLWPAAERFNVLCEAGLTSAIGGLDRMAKQWKRATKSQKPAMKSDCVNFAGRIVSHWPVREHARSSHSATDTASASLLSCLEALREPSLISRWISGVLARDVTIDPGDALASVCRQHGWSTFHAELRALFDGTTDQALVRNARLLAGLSLDKDDAEGRLSLCRELSASMILAMESWNPDATSSDWRHEPVSSRSLLSPMAQALLAIKEHAAFDRLVTIVLNRPKTFDLTTVQVPTITSLATWLRQKVKRQAAPLSRWLHALQQTLQDRVARVPQSPADWRRESQTGCNCADCAALSQFLADPNTETACFPLAKARRQHLHGVIDRRQLDTTHTTHRVGSPQKLMCRKTSASYDRAMAAHRLDLEQYQSVQKLIAWHVKLKP